MRILVACEESQAVTIELRRLGHEAYSCDIQDCSGGHPEWHIKGDALKIVNPECFDGRYGWAPHIEFETVDGEWHQFDAKWDMIIAFPPCTYLTVTGNRWFNVDRYGEKALRRHKERAKAIKFFMAFADADCPRIAIENPVGVMSSVWRKPNQIIQPYMFGSPARKATCLWLKGLKPLEATNTVEPIVIPYKTRKGTDNPWHIETMNLPPAERAKIRSKTFPGIARAMAEQWAGPVTT